MRPLLCLALLAGCAQDLNRLDESFYFRNDGADMFVRVQGNLASGAMLLVVHGGPGGSGHEYNLGTYEQLLEEQVAVAYWDQRGQGASQGDFDPEQVTLDVMARDAEALARLLQARYGPDLDLFMMGHSWGGTLGTAALVNTDIQSDLSGWIEADGAHDIPLLNREAIAMFLDVGQQQVEEGNNASDWEPILEFARGVDVDNISIEQGGEINYYGGEAEALIEDIDFDEALGLGQLLSWATRNPTAVLPGWVSGLRTSNQLLNEVEQTSLTDQLDRVTVPTLLLWGRFDFIVPPALGVSAQEHLVNTDSELVIFERSGHSPMSNEPEAFAQAVLVFMELNR